jgi:ligand-binding SRPBCC domain-containing protein
MQSSQPTRLCLDDRFKIQLEQRRDHLLHLKSRWTNSLASALRFNSHIANVPDVLQRTLGIALPSALTWAAPRVPFPHADLLDYSDTKLGSNTPSLASDLQHHDAFDHDDEQLLLADVIAGDPDEDDTVEVETDNVAMDVRANIVWTLPVCPTTSYTAPHPQQIQADIQTDHFLSLDYMLGVASTPNVTRYLYRNGRPTVQFNDEDIARLKSPTARLNDICINGGAVLLQGLLSGPSNPSSTHSQRCAILSTFDLPRVRYKLSDHDLWRHLSRNSSYWLHDIWIIPIHRAHPVEHWVLATAHLSSLQLFCLTV